MHKSKQNLPSASLPVPSNTDVEDPISGAPPPCGQSSVFQTPLPASSRASGRQALGYASWVHVPWLLFWAWSGVGGYTVVRGGSERRARSSPPILAFQAWACSDEGRRPLSAGLRVNGKERKSQVGYNYSKTTITTATTTITIALIKHQLWVSPF